MTKIVEVGEDWVKLASGACFCQVKNKNPFILHIHFGNEIPDDDEDGYHYWDKDELGYGGTENTYVRYVMPTTESIKVKVSVTEL